MIQVGNKVGFDIKYGNDKSEGVAIDLVIGQKENFVMVRLSDCSRVCVPEKEVYILSSN